MEKQILDQPKTNSDKTFMSKLPLGWNQTVWLNETFYNTANIDLSW